MVVVDLTKMDFRFEPIILIAVSQPNSPQSAIFPEHAKRRRSLSTPALTICSICHDYVGEPTDTIVEVYYELVRALLFTCARKSLAPLAAWYRGVTVPKPRYHECTNCRPTTPAHETVPVVSRVVSESSRNENARP